MQACHLDFYSSSFCLGEFLSFDMTVNIDFLVLRNIDCIASFVRFRKDGVPWISIYRPRREVSVPHLSFSLW